METPSLFSGIKAKCIGPETITNSVTLVEAVKWRHLPSPRGSKRSVLDHFTLHGKYPTTSLIWMIWSAGHSTRAISPPIKLVSSIVKFAALLV